MADKNPASLVKAPKIKEIERKPYEPAEIQKIEEAISQFRNGGIHGELTRERIRAFVAVLRWTGMRIGDAVQLTKEKIVEGQIILGTAKKGKRVSIPAHPEIIAAIEKIKKGNMHLFWSGNGTDFLLGAHL